VLFTALVIFFIGKSLASTKASFAGTMVFILLMHTYEPKYVSTNGETLINLFLVVSVYIFLFYDLKLKTLILHIISGIMLGLSVLTNYKAGVLPIAYIIYTFVVVPFFSFDKGKSFKGTAAKLVITGVASFVPVIAVAIYFYYKGNLQEALFWGFTYNFGYIESGSSSGSVLKIFGRSLYFIILGLPAWIAIVKGICSKIKNFKECVSYEKFQILIFLLLWILISFYAATLGGRGYGHYFIQIVPPLSLLVAFFYDDIYYKKVFWAWILIPVFIFTLSRIDIIRTYEIINYPNYKSEISYKKTGEFIKENSSPEDKIYVWGWATPVYYFADRRSASRFIISDFVSGRVFGTDNKSDAVRKDFASKFLPLLCDDLRTNKPLFVVDSSPSGYFGYDRFPISEFIELDDFIRKNYNKVAEIDKIVIYKLK